MLLTQYVVLVWNSRRYTSICLSFDDGPRVTICTTDYFWLLSTRIIITPEFTHIQLNRTLQMRIVPDPYTFSYIRFHKLIVTYLYRPSLEREISYSADPAVITNFQLQPKFSPGSHVPTFSVHFLSESLFSSGHFELLHD